MKCDPIGTLVFQGLQGEPWQLSDVERVGDTAEINWEINGASTTITLPHGEEIECTYYYTVVGPVPPTPTAVVPIPTLDPHLLALLAFGLVLATAVEAAKPPVPFNRTIPLRAARVTRFGGVNRL